VGHNNYFSVKFSGIAFNIMNDNDFNVYNIYIYQQYIIVKVNESTMIVDFIFIIFLFI